MLFVSGVLVFSRELYTAVEDWLGQRLDVPQRGAGRLLDAPGARRRGPAGRDLAQLLGPRAALRPGLDLRTIRAASSSPRSSRPGSRPSSPAFLTVWLIAVVPAEDTARWLLLASALVAVVAVLLLRRRLIYWHCVLEVELKNMIDTSETKMTSTTAPWLGRHPDWDLHMIDCIASRPRRLPGPDDRRARPARAVRLLGRGDRAAGLHDPAAAARTPCSTRATRCSSWGRRSRLTRGPRVPGRRLGHAGHRLALRGGAHGGGRRPGLERRERPHARRDIPGAATTASRSRASAAGKGASSIPARTRCSGRATSCSCSARPGRSANSADGSPRIPPRTSDRPGT